MTTKALDEAEQVVVIGLGLGLLYGGYRLIKVLGAAGISLGEQAGEQIDRAANAADVAVNSSLQAGANEWKNPECSDPNDPNCVQRQHGQHEIVDEQGNHVGWRSD